MLFNSIDFAIFLPIVFLLYWFVANRSIVLQNLLIVIASYVFYGWWDWRFLALILFSTVVDYIVGLGLARQENNSKRKMLLWTSIVVNLGLLGFFKYYNFFLDNFSTAFTFFGSEIRADSLNIILPVGISFYTFQTLSYSFDVYRRRLEPTRDFVAFAAFVSFFPQLVAGPIERASNLLPQFFKRRVFEYSNAVDGMRQMLWGLFKKIVIADNCAIADALATAFMVMGAEQGLALAQEMGQAFPELPRAQVTMACGAKAFIRAAASATRRAFAANWRATTLAASAASWNMRVCSGCKLALEGLNDDINKPR